MFRTFVIDDKEALVSHVATSEIPVTPPAQRVQFILGEEVGDDAHESHPLFSEMEELVKDGDEMEWKETARYFRLLCPRRRTSRGPHSMSGQTFRVFLLDGSNSRRTSRRVGTDGANPT